MSVFTTEPTEITEKIFFIFSKLSLRALCSLLAVSQRRKIKPAGRLWNNVLASTGQPAEMK
jgi:hypothetical protein